MGLMDNQTFLPGVITEVESDYSYGYDSSQFGTTEAVVIIGTAFSGPSGAAIEIYSPEHARYIFGGTYDAATKKEATLVAGIEDAYKRGCRTIYAVRVGGKDVQKDFALNSDTGYKLRVRAAYPTNQAKDFFMVYDHTEGDERIKIFKPSERATIVEKMQGAVESENSVIALEIKLNQDYGLTKDSQLSDVIETINTHAYNNVLRLSIVNDAGEDVTTSDLEARAMPLGTVFPGAYLIGRDENLIAPDTHIDYKLVLKDTDKPFSTFEGRVYRTLVYNTDLTSDLPIYAEKHLDLAENLKEVEIFSAKPFDFLETAGLADRAFGKDKNDYEEVSLSRFDIYKRLGSGFAVTAKIESRGAGLRPRVKETPVSDVNRIAELKDGIYSMLENLRATYRVLVCANADDKIAGKLPRADEFKVSTPVSVELLGGLIEATPVIKEDELLQPKEYRFFIKHLTDGVLFGEIESIFKDTVLDSMSIYNASKVTGEGLKNGSVFLAPDENGALFPHFVYENELVVKANLPQAASDTHVLVVAEENFYALDVNNKEAGFVKADQALIEGIFGTKRYVLVQNSGHIYVMEIDAASEVKQLIPLGDVETMLSENTEETIVFAQSNYFEVNDIEIKSAILDDITLEEFVEMLNEHKALKGKFEFKVTNEGTIHKDDLLTEIEVDGNLVGDMVEAGIDFSLPADRVTSYNYNKYIPYKTTDNFARQLAQHCTYTSLKTASAHGVIGLTPLNNRTLNGIADHVDSLMEKEFELYAKTPQGRNMLDRNNMPYQIGKNISIVVMQYPTRLDSGYSFRSNGAAGYAGTVSVLPLDQSSTNQPINVSEIEFELTNHQLTRLTQKGYVTIKNSYTRGFVITDGITHALPESPFRRLNVSRIMNAVEELIREAAEPYIGKQNHDANRNSLQTAIKSNLEKIKGTLIEAYEFNMVVDPAIMKFAYIDIDYNIVPIYEIREVRNRIKVKDEL